MIAGGRSYVFRCEVFTLVSSWLLKLPNVALTSSNKFLVNKSRLKIYLYHIYVLTKGILRETGFDGTWTDNLDTNVMLCQLKPSSIKVTLKMRVNGNIQKTKD